MIKLMQSLPRSLYVACSGGVDSMAALDFLRRNHRVTVVFFDHATETSKLGRLLVSRYCEMHQLPLLVGTLGRERPPGTSPEEHWRNERYAFLDALPDTDPVVVAHHLDDAIETWVWGSCHGQPRVMDYQRGRCVRPFLSTTKKELIAWAQRHDVPWYEDRSNQDLTFSRNQIRHCVIPEMLKVNPGISTQIRRKVVDKYLKTQHNTIIAAQVNAPIAQ